VQLYDERGNPINPRSHQYGKKLRGAQNDVLASVGVVERRHSPAEGFPGPSEERLELLEAEDTVGNAMALVTTLTENLCTWWVGTIRERILVASCHLSFMGNTNLGRHFAIPMSSPLARSRLPSMPSLALRWSMLASPPACLRP
jgi:hypothetical protein